MRASAVMVDRFRSKVRNASLLGLARLAGRYVALHAGWTPTLRQPQRRERVVFSLTTIPSRVRYLAPVLSSLLDQREPPDEVLLAVPERSLREGRAYPPVDAPGVTVLRCDDHGPATKLLPALRREAPETLVIAVDDDVVYPPDFLGALLAAHRRNTDAALGYRGWRVDPARDPRAFRHVLGTDRRTEEPVDVLLGTWGLAVQPRFFDEEVHALPAMATSVDDVWFSGQLARRGVPRLVVPARLPPLETWASRVQALTDGDNRSGERDAAMIRVFRDVW